RAVLARQQLRPARADDRNFGRVVAGTAPYNGQTLHRILISTFSDGARWLSGGLPLAILVLSQIFVERQLVMPSSAVAVRRLALAALALGAAPAFAQGLSEPSGITVQPARVPVAGSPGTYERSANLPPPPPGPIESRLVNIPAGAAAPGAPAPAQPAPAQPAPAQPMAAPQPGPTLAVGTPAAVPSPSPGGPFGTIAFAGRSVTLTAVTKSELDQIAKRIVDQKLRHIELRALADSDQPDSRKIALARALVVRSYLIDRGVKSRIEVGSFSGDGEAVEILVPST
ncbi:MAG TPA: OmpA family protein, partial [Ideonella sp.]|nr:OmpA family protein [Ideonella sp.]